MDSHRPQLPVCSMDSIELHWKIRSDLLPYCGFVISKKRSEERMFELTGI